MRVNPIKLPENLPLKFTDLTKLAWLMIKGAKRYYFCLALCGLSVALIFLVLVKIYINKGEEPWLFWAIHLLNWILAAPFYAGSAIIG